ncbi:hypothetical protein SDC9_61171 [bioreactor metagenome]|uniref:Uncharacterized protein n=1 Tax=bioreactor metagenome TaxID=1076179 RepID=A0A644XFY7_9ZZZZ|nr:hypothetical protein [Rikenellaceae bacterium]
MKGSRHNNYSKIRSISQLRAERIKIGKEIEIKEMQMEIEYSGFKESISITRFLTLMVTRITMIIPFIRTAKNIYEFIAKQFRQKDSANEAGPAEQTHGIPVDDEIPAQGEEPEKNV